MNGTKESIETVLERKPLIDASDLQYRRATKTKSIKAKPLANLMADRSILAKFLLDTLEGNQVLKANSMVCLGAAGDVWQQAPNKLLGKYTVTNVDEEGWLTCEPKPDNEVLAVQISEDECGPDGFTLIGQWGDERIVDGKQQFLQYGTVGDYVLQSVTDPTDRWIVKRGLYESTYDWKA